MAQAMAVEVTAISTDEAIDCFQRGCDQTAIREIDALGVVWCFCQTHWRELVGSLLEALAQESLLEAQEQVPERI